MYELLVKGMKLLSDLTSQERHSFNQDFNQPFLTIVKKQFSKRTQGSPSFFHHTLPHSYQLFTHALLSLYACSHPSYLLGLLVHSLANILLSDGCDEIDQHIYSS